MVCGEHVDGSTGLERRSDGGAVLCRFNGWIPFDVRSPLGIVCIGKPQVVRAGFCGNAFFGKGEGTVEKTEFARCRNVEHMQTRSGACGEFNGARRAAITGFCTPDDGVLTDGNVFTKLRTGGSRIGPDGGLVFAVRGDQHGAFFENAFEYRGIVDQHVAR